MEILEYKFDVGTTMATIRDCYDTLLTFGGIEAATAGVMDDNGQMRGRISIVLKADATAKQIFAIGAFIGYYDATIKGSETSHN